MNKKQKIFRLIYYMNGTESKGFIGGRAAASPFAYYYHIRKNGDVFLGGNMIFSGLGPYRSLINEYFEDKSIIKLPTEFNHNGIKIIISDLGYIYQNFDPLFGYVKNGIFWRYKIKKIGRKENFTDTDQERYSLSAYQIGSIEFYDKHEYEEGNKNNWKVLISDLQMLKTPFTHDNEFGKLLKTYDGNNNECNFYQNNGTPSNPRKNTFVHLSDNKNWTIFDKQRNFKKHAELTPTRIIDDQIKNNHIRESLIHEMFRILVAHEGWFINYELPVRLENGIIGRIDFLIKRKTESNDNWRVIEVKLWDTPDAIEQLERYIRGIRKDVNKNRDNSSYFWLLWDGEKIKNITGTILCARPASKETLTEARKKRFDVWTYEIFLVKDNNNEPLLGIKIFDENEQLILETKQQ